MFPFAFILWAWSLWDLIGSQSVIAYDMVRDYSGQSFFDGWDFYGGFDNLTLGNVYYHARSDAFDQGLAYTNDQGRAVMKVDNTTMIGVGGTRGSIRITSSDSYDVGSLWITDIVHVPWGCSVWPAFWTKGEVWPDNGEIDILEAMNLMPANQIALHTLDGCFKDEVDNQLGATGQTNCSTPEGCTVLETKPDSYGWGLNYGSTWVEEEGKGGGVWACQFDVSGIFVWFWPRPSIPQSILASTSSSGIDTSDWGNPTASYPASGCDIPTFFGPQRLVFTLTLCGIWAGEPAAYDPMCRDAGQSGVCYLDTVVGSGSPIYQDAYFEVEYVRAYTTGAPAPAPTGSQVAQAEWPEGIPTIGGHGVTTASGTVGTGMPTNSMFYFPDNNRGVSMDVGVRWWHVGVGMLSGAVMMAMLL